MSLVALFAIAATNIFANAAPIICPSGQELLQGKKCITIRGKSIIDVPNTPCPEGRARDHLGKCQDYFEKRHLQRSWDPEGAKDQSPENTGGSDPKGTKDLRRSYDLEVWDPKGAKDQSLENTGPEGTKDLRRSYDLEVWDPKGAKDQSFENTGSSDPKGTKDLRRSYDLEVWDPKQQSYENSDGSDTEETKDQSFKNGCFPGQLVDGNGNCFTPFDIYSIVDLANIKCPFAFSPSNVCITLWFKRMHDKPRLRDLGMSNGLEEFIRKLRETNNENIPR